MRFKKKENMSKVSKWIYQNSRNSPGVVDAKFKFEEMTKQLTKFYEKFEAEYKKADRFGKFVKQRKTECIVGKKIHAAPIRAWVDHVPELSTEYNDYAPSITMDGEEMVFTSDRPNTHTPNEVGKYDDDIYTSTMVDGKWQKPQPIKGKINTENDDISNNFSFSCCFACSASDSVTVPAGWPSRPIRSAPSFRLRK